MKADNLTTNIKYSGLTDGKLTVTVIDEHKGKWTVWKNAYQSAEPSEAFQALQNFRFGETFGVSYQEKDESFVNAQGKTINFKKRTIFYILPPVTNPTMQTATKPQNVAPSPTYSPVAQPRNYAQEGYSRCLWAYWLKRYDPFAGVKTADGTLGQAEMDVVYQVFQQIEADAEKRFAHKTGWDKARDLFGGSDVNIEEEYARTADEPPLENYK